MDLKEVKSHPIGIRFEDLSSCDAICLRAIDAFSLFFLLVLIYVRLREVV